MGVASKSSTRIFLADLRSPAWSACLAFWYISFTSKLENLAVRKLKVSASCDRYSSVGTASAAAEPSTSLSLSSSSPSPSFSPVPSLASRNAFRRLKRVSMSSPDGVAGIDVVVRGGSSRASSIMSSRGVRCLFLVLDDAVLPSLAAILLRIPLGRPDRRLATRR